MLGPIFTERVIAPPAPPVITSAADALAVVLNERGRVDIDHIAELLHREPDDVVAALGNAIFRDPGDGSWQTADAYLSGPVRDKLQAAEAAAAPDPAYERNVRRAARVQPADLGSVRYHRAARRAVDSGGRYRRLRQGDDGCRDPRSIICPSSPRGPVEARQLGWSGCRHLRMGHRPAGMPASFCPTRSTAACRRSSTR